MVSVSKFCLSLGCALVIGLSSAQAESPKASPTPETSEKTKTDKNKSKEEAKKDDGKSDSDPANFDIPVPIGVPVKGIRVPQYNEDGKQVMLFDAEVARKIDEDNIAMEQLKIEATSEDDKKFYIELPKAVFNLQTRILAGTDRINIKRDDFEITGDAGEFQTKTRFAKITGDVKMIIFNTENLNN